MNQKFQMKSFEEIPDVTTKLSICLDMDNTLISTTLEPSETSDFTVDLQTPNGTIIGYVTKRPYLTEFLNCLTKIANVYLFTAAESNYAQQILSEIDPSKTIFSKAFFRDSCSFYGNGYYKDINIIGSPLEKTVLIDDSPMNFGFHPENGLQILPFTGNLEDSELPKLFQFLINLISYTDVRMLLRGF